MRLPGKKELFLFWLWVRRDFSARYAGSIGGFAWALLLPLLTVFLFYLVFALVLKVRAPAVAGSSGYFYYLLAGLLPWLGISEGLSRAATSLAGQEQFLQKLVFPVELLPATAVVTSLVPQLVGTVFYVALLVYAGQWSGVHALWWPLIFLCQVVIMLGAGLALAIVGLYVRDLVQVFPLILQIFFYTAPILFPLDMIPERFHSLLLLNPFTGLVECYQYAFLSLPVPLEAMLSLGLWTLLLGVGGILLFRYLKPAMGDLL